MESESETIIITQNNLGGEVHTLHLSDDLLSSDTPHASTNGSINQQILIPAGLSDVNSSSLRIVDGGSSTIDEEIIGQPLSEDQITTVALEPELDDQSELVMAANQTNLDTVEDDDNGLIIQHMDIEEPLTTLRKLLEKRLHCSFADHDFYLQDSILLDPSKNLVSQCVQGSGRVQINVELKSSPNGTPRINIIDILKPAEEMLDLPEGDQWSEAQFDTYSSAHEPKKSKNKKRVVIPFTEESDNVTRWIVDQAYRKEQERLNIPFDPKQWEECHVKHWIEWAVNEFKLIGVDIDNFTMNGPTLCDMTHDDFTKYIPYDKGDIFWTHLELLRKCKFVAVIQVPTPNAITTITVSSGQAAQLGKKTISKLSRPRAIMVPSASTPGNRTGNNGQIQLWQFLLELLTDKDYLHVITWITDDGEFKLHNPEYVAQLWGQRKNKPQMNYEKLSRALRYYYDGDMISKVHGKKFVYKFVCDLKMLLGYNALELNHLVQQCADKSGASFGGKPAFLHVPQIKTTSAQKEYVIVS